MQYTSRLLMIEPFHFTFNQETAINNVFQSNPASNVHAEALQEFHSLVAELQKNKIDVTVIKDTPGPVTPDSIFPNNWISFHADGNIFLYPMFAENRRKERKESALQQLHEHFKIKEIIDLSYFENNDLFLEGTGSMVLDRENKIAYACLSPRTSLKVVNEFCRLNEYDPLIFCATDIHGTAIYHTNVMMCVADKFAVICLESIQDGSERKKIGDRLLKTGKEIIDISFQQMNCFAGNMLQVSSSEQEVLLIMSTQAYNALTFEQIHSLEKYNRIIHTSLDHIEATGGGSARCMIAEIFNKPL
ncbi:MAG: arginine deiminase-related protein [Ferruginibacter sp.]